MKIYSEENVRYIVEEFFAKLFKLDIAMLDENSIKELKEICDGYGLDVSDIDGNKHCTSNVNPALGTHPPELPTKRC